MISAKALNQTIDGCTYLKWSQALWLPKWSIYTFPVDDTILRGVHDIGLVLENLVEELYGAYKPIIHSWYRPKAYNSVVGGRPFSWHLYGSAVDFSIPDHSAERVRDEVAGLAEKYRIRVEQLPKGASWCHVDLKPVFGRDKRYFIP
jgi:hypothetical protein